MGRMEPIAFEARDGYNLHGYLTLPPNYKGEKLPMIVFPHGGPWTRDFWGFNPTAQFFATRGYAVLQVNYRGSIGFGKSHLQAGIKGVHTVLIDDVADGAQFCINSNGALHLDELPKSIVVAGCPRAIRAQYAVAVHS